MSAHSDSCTGGWECAECVRRDPGAIPEYEVVLDDTDKVSEASQALLAAPEKLVEVVLALKDLILAFDDRLKNLEERVRGWLP